MNETSAFRTRLEAAVNARHSRLNPFTERWVKGELSRAQLGAWAAQHYQYVSQFPRWCATVYGTCTDPDACDFLLENIVEVQHHGEAGTVADEDGFAVASVDVASRTRHEHPAVVLFALLRVAIVALDQLLVGQPADENQELGGDEKIKQDDPRIVALVGDKKAVRGLGEIALVNAHGRDARLSRSMRASTSARCWKAKNHETAGISRRAA